MIQHIRRPWPANLRLTWTRWWMAEFLPRKLTQNRAMVRMMIIRHLLLLIMLTLLWSNRPLWRPYQNSPKKHFTHHIWIWWLSWSHILWYNYCMDHMGIFWTWSIPSFQEPRCDLLMLAMAPEQPGPAGCAASLVPPTSYDSIKDQQADLRSQKKEDPLKTFWPWLNQDFVDSIVYPDSKFMIMMCDEFGIYREKKLKYDPW